MTLCCINKCPQVLDILHALRPLLVCTAFCISCIQTTSPSLSLPFYLLHNLTPLCHLPPSPPYRFSIHPSKDTSTAPLSSSCWRKIEAYLHRLLPNINAQMHPCLAKGTCLMKSRGATADGHFSLVTSFSRLCRLVPLLPRCPPAKAPISEAVKQTR